VCARARARARACVFYEHRKNAEMKYKEYISNIKKK